MTTPSIDNLTNVNGIGPAAIEKFRDAGYGSLADVANATIDEITAVPGIGEATAQAILEYVTDEMDAGADEHGDTAAEHDPGEASQQVERADDTGEDEPVEEMPAVAPDDGDVESVSHSHEEWLRQLSADLSSEHLTLLRVFHDPQHWAQEHQQEYPQTSFLELSTVAEYALPEWRSNQALYDQLWHDLYERGLVTTETLHVMTSRAGAISERTSDLGAEVLTFVADD